MQLVKCSTIETLDDPIFYAIINGKNETSGNIVKAFREYWMEQNQPPRLTESEKQALEQEVDDDLACQYADYARNQDYFWQLY